MQLLVPSKVKLLAKICCNLAKASSKSSCISLAGEVFPKFILDASACKSLVVDFG